jgi:4,5-DOPA dioxygenase extradiol
MSVLPIELRSSDRQPVWFIGHGSPMNALQDNPFTQSLHQLGASIPAPQAILVVSAHWLTRGATFVQASEKPETLHDFGGFSPALHQFQYPAPGSPSFASLLTQEVHSVQSTTGWGLDHGAWTVLTHLFPSATIPCFELSIDYSRPLAYHISLARELQFLREKGVLIIGSGNIVHNLQASMPNLHSGQENFGYDWAHEFDQWSTKLITDKNVLELLAYEQAPGGRYAVPTPDHYIPLLYSVALARADEEVVSTFEHLVYGGISMRCFAVR